MIKREVRKKLHAVSTTPMSAASKIAAVNDANTIRVTGDIVAAYVANKEIQIDALIELIGRVHQTLSSTHKSSTLYSSSQMPAVPIEESIEDQYIICLEDGRRMKSLKNYLMRKYGMTPDQYRYKWKLPSDYPMVAPEYARRRSAIAYEFKFGHGPGRGGRAK